MTIDIVGHIPRSTSGHEYLLVLFDHFIKFAQAFPVRNTSPVTLAKKVMDEYTCHFGCIKGLHSDQGASVDGAVFKGVWDLIDAAKTRTTPHHPQGDGQVERLDKSLVKILSKLSWFLTIAGTGRTLCLKQFLLTTLVCMSPLGLPLTA